MAEEILRALQSPDNNLRKAAEKQLNDMVETNFMGGLQLLAQGLALPQPELAEMASVLMCRLYLSTEEQFAKIPAETLQQLVLMGQQQLIKDAKLSYLKRMNDLVVKVLLRLERYDDMMQFIMSQQPSSTNMKLSLLYFIEMMCEFAFDDELLVKNSQNLNQVFTTYLNDADPNVRVAALRSLTTFLQSIDTQATLMKFHGAVPTLLQKCIEAIQIDQESAVVALQALNDLLEHHPKFLASSTSELLAMYTELMGTPTLLPQLRRAALHGLQVLAQVAPVQLRKDAVFKERTAMALMRMLTEVDESGAEWETDFEDNCLQSQEISAAAQDCLAKMAGDLTVKFMLPLFIKMIVPALQSQNWRDQHAGLVAMAMLSEGSAKHFQNDLDSIVQAVLPLGTSGSTRIIYDVMTCFALLCQEFHPTIQKKYGQQVLSLVVACMQQNASMKLKYRGTACLVDFCRELVEDVEDARTVLAPYAQSLLELLYQQINENLSKTVTDRESKIAQEALTALSALAAALKTNFAGFYDTIMPAMIRIMQTLPQTGEQYTDIRTLLIECMGFVLGSIADSRKDQFNQDSQTLMNQFLAYQATLETDNQAHPALFSFYAQVAQGMKTGFAAYLPQVFDFVERAIKIDLGFSVSDAVEGQTSTSSKVAKFRFDLKLAGLKTLELNTSALEQKIEGAHTLLALIENCCKSYAPLLQRTAPLVMEYMTFKNSRDIRETMAKCVYHMMMACSAPAEMAQVFNFVSEPLLKECMAVLQKGDCEAASLLLEQVGESVQLLRQPLIADQLVRSVVDLCAQAMQLCKSEKAAILKEFAEEEQDALEQDRLKDDYEDIDDLMDSVVNIAAHLIKYYPVENQLVNFLMPPFYELLVNAQSTQNEFINAVAFFNTVLPYCSQGIFEKGLAQIGQIYLSRSQTTDLALKQNLLYGMGEFARKASAAQYASFLPIVQQVTIAVLGEPDIKSESKLNSFETAVATMGKLGLYQGQTELLQRFIENLPLSQSDAQETHLMLLKQVEINNPALMPLKDQLLTKLKDLRMADNNNPENEILCDEGRQLINKLVC